MLRGHAQVQVPVHK